ncbi:hypothetical protein BJY16_006830 [Actinoplanes octamycinicus]|uniref:Uncharacterized protein n=1 Tax=Actinoplanes octamycinicus TaxID=135948 RepID=A0A7W7MAX3_9ACTN|nr:hypothetical protein [Actinoplanes octamycinicus]MBB4743371.1 hypothetical protein [Actinoplanes octamycinicus]
MPTEWGSVETGALLASPLAPLALWSSRRPPDVADRVAERIAALTNPEERLVLLDLSMLAEDDLAEQVIEALRSDGYGI